MPQTQEVTNPVPKTDHRVRVVTATSLFDGHDVAINIIRRMLHSFGAEVIHLGHDRSVDEIVSAVIQENADAVAVSSYQGGHIEFYQFLIDRLRELGAGHIKVFGGGGGTIVPEEIEALHNYGVTRIFRPEDGQRIGFEGMIQEIIDICAGSSPISTETGLDQLSPRNPLAVARLITWMEERQESSSEENENFRKRLRRHRDRPAAPVVGFTGTGGAGKSCLLDEIVRRFRREYPQKTIGILTVDPTRQRSGGALLGDRLRMNAIGLDTVFVRSMATRQTHLGVSQALADGILVLQAADFDLVLVETAGIGQAESEIVDLAALSVYVMTPEYGSASQLEKIEMLDVADIVAVNKFDRQGGQDSLRDVRKQWRRNRNAFQLKDEEVPVYPTIASRWDDPGTDRFYQAVMGQIAELGFNGFPRRSLPAEVVPKRDPLVPGRKVRYLSEIADSIREFHLRTAEKIETARKAYGLSRALEAFEERVPEGLAPFPEDATGPESELGPLRRRYNETIEELGEEMRQRLASWGALHDRYEAETQSYRVRDNDIRVLNHVETLSGLQVPKIALPKIEDWGERLRFLCLENVPGKFPFTGGVFPFKRTGEEDPTRMFAGEGGPERTNRRFHYLSHGQPSTRLSTAFDSPTLYGHDPDERPDIYGKVGTSGVSICTLDDAKKLYSGFDLLSPKTSVSMTINGPAPVILAFFFNAAIDQTVEKHLRETGQIEHLRARLKDRHLPEYEGEFPEGHNGLGLGLLGLSGEEAVDPETYARIRADALRNVRGTVQADILKEDQAQNTCIFSTEFALRMMGDVQEFFITNKIRNFYSISISGFHMAEAGAFPITQLAFTLANAFTYCEYYLARGMDIDDFAPNFSFFFSNGLDPEYSVIGRVARRIWAVAMRERYHASERSQKLKYHSQTSGRSLHAQEMEFNDIRTTLQALTALQDHCNSLHTNAYDEAVTTPTEKSVRRALAIQLILNREFGPLKTENLLQGSYLLTLLTDRVEEAVLEEFDRLSERGGVLGAMETMYQRGKIQEESMHYETLKHSGELPIVGVNTFENTRPENAQHPVELIRGTEDEKQAQLKNLRAFQARHAPQTPIALNRLQEVSLQGGNTFHELMETVKVASLGQIVNALYEVGGKYRRSM